MIDALFLRMEIADLVGLGFGVVVVIIFLHSIETMGRRAYVRVLTLPLIHHQGGVNRIGRVAFGQ
jgi:hypothetical protein